MIVLNAILYLTMPELTEAGIKYTCAKWFPFKIKNPADKRCDLFPYEQLAPKYKALVDAKFKNVYEYHAACVIKKYLKEDLKAYEFYHSYKLDTGEGLPEQHIDKYIKAAQWLNLLLVFEAETKGFKHKYNMTREQFWNNMVKIIVAESIALPTSTRHLQPKIAKYRTDGYISIISGRFGNTASKKITDAGERWLIANFGSPVKRLSIEALYLQYNEYALAKGDKPLKDKETLRVFLNKPAVTKQWYGSRYGELKFKEKYGYQLKTNLPTFRDALWYSDGTKLNFYYRDKNGMEALLKVYEVVDVYSECLLGYYIGEKENYEAQYNAYRNAIMFSQAKPYEIKYDNQGGHKKLKNGDFLKDIARISVNTQPYNGKSKTIESVFNRFQTQLMSEKWYNTGQNITTKKIGSKTNKEFVLENHKQLPSLEEAMLAYDEYRNKWNNGINNSIGLPRKAAYLGSVNPHHSPVNYLQMVDLFWVTKAEPLTYYTSGIDTEINKIKYQFEVLDNGMPDVAFRDLYIGQKFIVKYDPLDFSYIRLYIDKGMGAQFVSIAQPRISVPRAQVDHLPGDPKKINDLLDIRQKERIDAFVAHSVLMYDEGVLPEQHGLNSVMPKGISATKLKQALALAGIDDIVMSKKDRKTANKDKETKTESYAQALKAESEMDTSVLSHW